MLRSADPKAIDERWRQVLSRDARFDGHFVYGVRSTRIYCRPTCPSRRPRRSNVDFFEKPNAAEAAGFRACKRCLPATAHPLLQIVEAVCDYIDSRLDERVTLADISRHSGFSPFHLQRSFRKVLGLSPLEYQSVQRVERFKNELRQSGNVADAAYATGYGSSSRLYEHAVAHLGMRPSAYLRKGSGENITFGIFSFAAQNLLLAITRAGVCRLQIANEQNALAKNLFVEFPQAVIERNDRSVEPLATSLRAFIDAHCLAAKLASAVRTAALRHAASAIFQQRRSSN